MIEVTSWKIWVMDGRKFYRKGAPGISTIISKLQAKSAFAKTAIGHAIRSL